MTSSLFCGVEAIDSCSVSYDDKSAAGRRVWRRPRAPARPRPRAPPARRLPAAVRVCVCVCVSANLFAHPALKPGLGCLPQIKLGIELQTQTFDVKQSFLQQHQLRLYDLNLR